ncbi:alpha/beta fold hydrolase [Phytoactinopolyspora mesophila]|uniref:Alpha/beta fold hydrolase n=1 Tax=Phytoactinopolyspora mesophila TaxID=2650750 RepID=A0A7K3M8Q7_9ACTN|nr:alpha/beta hydrolase [Phytoactinopolyspora mesophila]NDL59580.1 alpha/beta fold hydrolase [Phytoactinopolyspora mesophila]
MPESMTDRIVQTGKIGIAAREYGGSGHPVLLLHGAGGNLAAWDVVGPMLSARHRAVAVDLRGHGQSGDGPWNWETVLSDLEAVSNELDLRRAVVVGHSLGGVLGARWARRNPDCPAVVSLDGHRSPVPAPQNYDADAAGLTPGELSRQVAQLSAMFDGQAAAASAPLSDDHVEAMLTAQRSIAVQHGADPELAAAAARRGLVLRDGATFVRPGPETANALRDSVQTDSLPVFAELTMPVLLVLATNSVPQVPAELEPLMTAFRAGLRRDVDVLIAANPSISIHEMDASHAMLSEKPADVAESITSFVARVLGTR